MHEELMPTKGLLLVEVRKEVQTQGGLVLPQMDRKSETFRGQVVTMGAPKEGIDCEVKEGDEVLFMPSAAIGVLHENRVLFFVGQEDVVAIVKTCEHANGKASQLVGAN